MDFTYINMTSLYIFGFNFYIARQILFFMEMLFS